MEERATGSNKEGIAFYQDCIRQLQHEHCPFLIGGAYALSYYTGIQRNTKDLDIFVRPSDAEQTLSALSEAGYRAELVCSAWLGKAYFEEAFIDIIFRSGNGMARVDDIWFERSKPMNIFGLDVKVCPPEETIWSKAFTMERDRFDLADIIHLIQACGPTLDWQHLLNRFGDHWRVLFVYLILFGYVFPGEKSKIPDWVMTRLQAALKADQKTPSDEQNLCRGTLLSGSQYLNDIMAKGYQDARFTDAVDMTDKERQRWKEQLDDELQQRIEHAGLDVSGEQMSTYRQQSQTPDHKSAS